MSLDWSTSSSKHLMLALCVTIGCGDDGGTTGDGPGSTSAATTMSGSATSESGSAGTSEGSTAAATSTGNGTGDASLGTTDGATTDGATTDGTTTDGTTDGTTGGSQGVEVGSCDECSAEELCMQLTEHAGPADGGGPDVTVYCFAYPAACDEALDCRCAGYLCPDPGGGSAAWCEVGDGILHCSVAYP